MCGSVVGSFFSSCVGVSGWGQAFEEGLSSVYILHDNGLGLRGFRGFRGWEFRV